MKKDNTGFTLIEVVVTIAIIAIFSGVVLTFIGTGAANYRSTSGTAKAQMEVQQALDQIQDILLDVNRGVYYTAAGDDFVNPINAGEIIFNDIDNGDGRSKVFFMTSAVPSALPDVYEYSCHVIQWNNTTKDLEYGIWTWQEAQFPKIQLNKTILAEDIVGFEADISKSESKHTVRLQLISDKHGKKVNLLTTVALRNQIQITKPVSDYNNSANNNETRRDLHEI